jgi:uncharacterized protein (TIGR02147 family)
MSQSKVLALLNQAFKRKKLKNPQYSLAWLARDMEVSRVFISRVFSGGKTLPLDRVDGIAKALEMDEVSQEGFLNAIVEEALSTLSAQSSLLKKHLKSGRKENTLAVFEKYKEIPTTKFHRLSPWYNTALLDMISMKDFRYDFEWMEKRLGVPASQLKRSWFFLLEHGLIEEVNGQWKKSEADIRFPTKTSHEMVRNYHEALIMKGLDTMKRGHSPEDFNSRLITGVTLTANLNQLEQTKLDLQAAQYQAAETLSSGECTEVYHLALMLYPLTKK